MVKNGVTFISDSAAQSLQLLSKLINEIGMRGIVDTYKEIGDYVINRKEMYYLVHIY